MERRIIRIGQQTMIGVVCPYCALKTIIYPESALLWHKHAHHPDRPMIYHRKTTRSHGRPPGIHTPVMGAARSFREGIKAR